MAKADKLAQACLRFCETSSVPWWLENPALGLLRDRDFMRARPYHTVSYCKYSAAKEPCCPAEAPCPVCDFRRKYQKNTAIWTNSTWKPEMRPCRGGSRCDFISDNRHAETIGSHGGCKSYPVPGRLVHEIFTHLLAQVRTSASRPACPGRC